MMQSQLCLRYSLSRLNVKHFDIIVGTFWSLIKEGNNQKEKKGRKEQKQSRDINVTLRGSNHTNLISLT